MVYTVLPNAFTNKPAWNSKFFCFVLNIWEWVYIKSKDRSIERSNCNKSALKTCQRISSLMNAKCCSMYKFSPCIYYVSIAICRGQYDRFCFWTKTRTDVVKQLFGRTFLLLAQEVKMVSICCRLKYDLPPKSGLFGNKSFEFLRNI